ncbi:40897_t:CDS:2, partial [Gigaspora margarita]
INDNSFPATIEQLNQQIQQRNLPIKWKFPIDKQEEFPEAADFLCRTFLDIFDNNNSADMAMMEIPKLNDGATPT